MNAKHVVADTVKFKRSDLMAAQDMQAGLAHNAEPMCHASFGSDAWLSTGTHFYDYPE
jgi:hypothetical protein